jgi:hypothetical protein
MPSVAHGLSATGRPEPSSLRPNNPFKPKPLRGPA